MKNKLLRIGLAILAVGCLLLILFLCGFGHCWIGVRQVDKIELTAGDEVGTATVELNATEVRKFMLCYHLSRYVGEVNAENCDRIFFVRIYLNDGNQIHIADHINERMKVTGLGSQSVWIDNAVLLGYVKRLTREYDLLWTNLGC